MKNVKKLKKNINFGLKEKMHFFATPLLRRHFAKVCIRLEIHLFEAKESERKRAAAKIKKQKEVENKKLEEKRKINDEKFKEWLK